MTNMKVLNRIRAFAAVKPEGVKPRGSIQALFKVQTYLDGAPGVKLHFVWKPPVSVCNIFAICCDLCMSLLQQQRILTLLKRYLIACLQQAVRTKTTFWCTPSPLSHCPLVTKISQWHTKTPWTPPPSLVLIHNVLYRNFQGTKLVLIVKSLEAVRGK